MKLIAVVAAAPARPRRGGRSLSLSCRGAGSPTVVIESGLGVHSGTWPAVQQRVAAQIEQVVPKARR